MIFWNLEFTGTIVKKCLEQILYPVNCFLDLNSLFLLKRGGGCGGCCLLISLKLNNQTTDSFMAGGGPLLLSVFTGNMQVSEIKWQPASCFYGRSGSDLP